MKEKHGLPKENQKEVEMSDIKCTVKSIKGECPIGYKVGDHFFLKDMGLIEAGDPKGICLHALAPLSRSFKKR